MPAPRAVLLLAAAALAAALLTPTPSSTDSAGAASAASAATAARAAPDNRPNILLITTDDQRLSDMKYMPRTRRAIGAAGATFSNMMSPHPLCCPARAEILTGQYAHNNGVRSNDADRLGGWPRLDNRHTIATWLTAAGYRTAFVGKYLNGYKTKKSRHEPGWEIWSPLLRYFRYFGYFLFEDGERKQFPDTHSSDLVGQRTEQYIRRLSSSSDRPFFLWSSHYAPHGECHKKNCAARPVPARRHRHLFEQAVSPSTRHRSFNEKDVSDKPPYIRKLSKQKKGKINSLFRSRIRTLQAADEAVAGAVDALRDAGELGNTLIMFTSDNGYLLGEHRYVKKDVPYEQALRVPLLVRGPGVPRGVARRQVVSMVDIAPTIVDLADARPNHALDGRTMMPILRRNAKTGYQAMLIQSGPKTRRQVDNGWSFRGVRTQRYTYARWRDPGFVELYDRRKDPAQMRNVARVRSYRDVVHQMQRKLQRLSHCKGAACRRGGG